MQEDWDNLIILDACRFDQFKRLNTISGQLESRISLGSATPEFLMANFEDKHYNDTIYVTANPMYRTMGLADIFHDVIDVWEFGWDEELKTVHPSQMAKATLEAYQSYPNKRILSHFMQPHYPFIGEKAQKIGDHAGQELTYRRAKMGEGDRDDPTVWQLLKRGKVGIDTVQEAYDENLKIALPHVDRLIKKFDERTVVTSDHGNLVGERIVPFGAPMYGHPADLYTEHLRKVPWLVIPSQARKHVTSDYKRQRTLEDERIVSERLAHLGYSDDQQAISSGPQSSSL